MIIILLGMFWMTTCLPVVCFASSDTLCTVIPQSARVEIRTGSFILRPGTKILVEDESSEILNIAEYLAGKLRIPTGYEFSVEKINGNTDRKNSIILSLAGPDNILGEEDYKLIVKEESILLSAKNPCGLFHGVQTIRQLLPPEIESDCFVQRGVNWTIPCIFIEDKPRFSWRGLMLDCSDTFLSVDYIKNTIDILAYYKLSRLHLHLTDDMGWRIEIKRYPRLTEIGAWGIRDDGMKTGGFYTQEELRDIVKYAESRYVMIVPEIEMPGHSASTVAAYPEICCRPGPFKVKVLPITMLYKENLCAGKELTFEFLDNIISEVIDIFPSPYFHIGADECMKDFWKSCPRCQARMKKEGLNNEDELQSYFVKRVEKILNSKDRRLIGWDEILDGGLAPNAIVMSWRSRIGLEGITNAVREGHDIIMSPTSHCYLDYNHKKTSLQETYSYEPVPAGLTAEQGKHILGVQGNMWTHLATLRQYIDPQLYPRLLAIGEVGWSPAESRDWEYFSWRIMNHYRRLDLMKVNYYKFIDYSNQ